jgi:hypothetical protein
MGSTTSSSGVAPIVDAEINNTISMADYLAMKRWSRSGLQMVLTGRKPEGPQLEWGIALALAVELSANGLIETDAALPKAWAPRATPIGWSERVAAMPKGIRGNNKTKFLSENKDKVCVAEQELEKVRDAFHALWHHSEVGPVLKHRKTIREVTITGTETQTTLGLRSRPDLVLGRVIFDVKSSWNPEETAFEKDIIAYGYDMQAALNVDLWKAATGQDMDFAAIVVGKDGRDEDGADPKIGIYQFGPKLLNHGRRRYRTALRIVQARGLQRPTTDVPLYWTAEPRVLDTIPPWEADKLARLEQYADALEQERRAG